MTELSWNEYHINNAKSVSTKSKDPSSKVGCVIVNEDNEEVCQGYNGNIQYADETFFTWDRPRKYLTVLHAEQNAILRARRDLKGCKAYVTHGPCETCLKLLLAAKIREIWYEDPSIMRDRSSLDQKWAIKALILATGAQVRNINGTSYIDDLNAGDIK